MIPRPPLAEISLEVAPDDAEVAADLLWRAGASAVAELRAGHAVRVVSDADADTARRLVAGRWSLEVRALDPAEPWLDEWRRHAVPVRAGERVVLWPSWLAPAEAADDLVVLLDPGRAFGSGSHPSTRLAVAALEQVVQPGHVVLDVGCGSGVLAIAALLLGARRAVAVDVDPEAVAVTAVNAARNGVDDRVEVSDRMPPGPSTFDVVVANIDATVLVPMVPDLTSRLEPSGSLVLSGMLGDRAEAIAASASGLAVRWRGDESGWCALVLASEAR